MTGDTMKVLVAKDEALVRAMAVSGLKRVARKPLRPEMACRHSNFWLKA